MGTWEKREREKRPTRFLRESTGKRIGRSATAFLPIVNLTAYKAEDLTWTDSQYDYPFLEGSTNHDFPLNKNLDIVWIFPKENPT